MLRLQDIVTRDVVTLDPEMTLRDALDILAARHISGAPVVEGDRVVGVFSATDVIEFLTTTPAVPDIADSDEEGEPRALADREDAAAEAGAAYFIDFWSDAGADVAERFHDTGAAAWDLLAEHTVGEAMSRSLVAFGPGADARAAADAMQRTHAHRVLVIDGDRLAGIVSALDIARAVAQRKLDTPRYVYRAPRVDGRKRPGLTGRSDHVS
jgi:CBS domain-containing protein